MYNKKSSDKFKDGDIVTVVLRDKSITDIAELSQLSRETIRGLMHRKLTVMAPGERIYGNGKCVKIMHPKGHTNGNIGDDDRRGFWVIASCVAKVNNV